MEKVKLVKKGEVNFQLLMDEVKKNPEIEECGAIVSFMGIVRGVGHDGTRVKELYYEAAVDEAVKSLKEIREQTLKKNKDVKELLIYHVIDTLKPGEETIYILAAGKHRQDAFNASIQALEEVKKKPLIWKKEITEKQAYWVSELKK